MAQIKTKLMRVCPSPGVCYVAESGPFQGRRLRRLWLTLLPLLAVIVASSAQGLDRRKEITQYVQTTLTDKNGLPQNSTRCITQTKDGYIWFGTEEGLARFDGLHVTVFDTLHSSGLKDNYVNALAPGNDGSLWVGTRSGLTRFKDGVFRTYISAESPIEAVYEAVDGRIWVGSMNGLYSVGEEGVRLFTVKDGLPGAIHQIAQTSDGTLWFGTDGGLVKLKDHHFHVLGPVDGLPSAPILSISTSKDNSLWVGTAAGLLHWKAKVIESWPSSSLPLHARISYLLEDRGGTLWIGFDHDGIATLVDGKLTRYTSHDGLPDDDVKQIFEDQKGHLWVSLPGGGVVELRDSLFRTFGMREGMSENTVWSVTEARDGSIWVGTNSKGLNQITSAGEIRSFTTRDGLPGNSIGALAEGPDQSMWFGSEHGVLSRMKAGRVTQFRDPAVKDSLLQAIVPDAEGGLWLAFHQSNGLAYFRNGSFKHYPIPGLLNTLTRAPDGSIWTGSYHGGLSHLKNGTITTFTTAQGLLSNFAQAVYVDPDGVVWAGTSPGGLNRIKDGKVTTYSIAQGLFDLTVGGIVEDDFGNLWMTCNKGIYKVSKKELNDFAEGRIPMIHSVVYGTAEGMRTAECNFGVSPSVWKSTNGHLWFATEAGVVTIDPAHSEIQNSQPSPRVEHVLFNQQPLNYGGQATAVPGGGDIEIQYTAPNFVAPERLRFRYRLKNFDRDWVNVGSRRQAYYTKLPPGHYVFEVQAADGDGGWSPHIAALKLTITPRIWQTGWFEAICGVFSALLGGALYRMRVHYLVARNSELETRVQQRTKQLREAIQEAEAAHHALKEQATRDGLTKLWNRRSILEILEREAGRARREGLPICVLLADVDHFKNVNDTHGHVAGDGVLEEVARRLVGMMRRYDSAGRYGGEEFLIVLPGCSLIDGIHRAEEFRCAITQGGVMISTGVLEISCSFGVASHTGEAEAGKLILEADEALYVAKRAGRNRVKALSMSLS